MAVRVTWVRFGSPATEALRAALAEAKRSEPLEPVTVVVPSNHVGVGTRRLLAASSARGLVGVTFLTVYRLAELLGATRLAGSGRRPVSTPVIAAAIRAALSVDPGVFEPVASHPATENALVAAYRELRDLTGVELAAIAAAGGRAADVVRLHRQARAQLVDAWYDEEDLLDAAVEATPDGVRRAGIGALVVYLPRRLTRHGAALLTAAAETADVIVIAGITGVGRADAETRASVTRLSPEAPDPPPADPLDIVAVDRTSFVTTSDADEEVRSAVRAVVEQVRAGTRFDRIALLHASPEPYARLAHEHLAAAGIPVNGAAVSPLAASLAGRTLLGALTLPEGAFRRQDVFTWLASGPILDRGRWAPVTAWERASREAGVISGIDWDVRLARLADSLEADAELATADPDQPDWVAERSRDQAARARSLRTFVRGLMVRLDRASSAPHRWGEHCAWARELLGDHLGAERRRVGWPAAEIKAADAVDVALDRLGALDGVEGPVGLDVFARTLALELDAGLGRVGRLGEGVLVGSVAMGVGLDLDLVIVLGLAEGAFPAPVRDDALLPDHERERAGDALVLRSLRADRQHHDLLAVLAGAARHRLSVPRGDLRRSTMRVPSRWALDIASSLADTRWESADLLRADVPWVEHVASFDAGLRRMEFPPSAQQYRLRSLMAGSTTIGDGTDVRQDRGAAMVAARQSTTFTRFDGNLESLAVPSPAGRATSATRLERWIGCPFAYFLENVLRVEPVENPEDQLRVSAMTWGEIVHAALERFVREALDGVDGPPAPGEPWSAERRKRLQQVGADVCGQYEQQGLTGRPLYWRLDRARILAELDRFLDADNAFRHEAGATPIAAELAFGLPRATVDSVEIELADGRRVAFRGRADRIDEDQSGGLRVLDYKTGKADRYRQISEDDPVLGGSRLQLPVYGLAARAAQGRPDAPVTAEYWFISTTGGWARVGYPVTEAVLAHFRAAVTAIVSGIEDGVFVALPSASSTNPRWECPFCDPDRLGVADLRRQFERKSVDPRLAIFAAADGTAEAG